MGFEFDGFGEGWGAREEKDAVGGGGGGKADLAQAGGKIPAKLPDALQIAKETWASMLA